MTSILDKSFKYVPASETDLRRTFRRVRREMLLQQTAPSNPPNETARVAVLPMLKRGRAVIA